MKKTLFLTGILVSAAFAFPARSQNLNPVPNPGFEEGEANWKFGEEVSRVTPDAARTGKNGLRVKIDSPRPRGSSVFSARLPVEPEKEITLSFWAKTTKRMGGVYLYFYSADGKIIKDKENRYSGGLPHKSIATTDGQWHEYRLTTRVPAGAAAVAAWVHAYSSNVGLIDLDDFAFSGLPANAKPVPIPRAAPRPHQNRSLPKHPPFIILKLDDVCQKGAGEGQAVSSRWQKLVDFVEDKKIVANLGIIGNSLEGNHQIYFDWLKEQDLKGSVEFWNHGHTHKELPRENGKRRCEFSAPLDEQIATLRKTQKLAKEKAGITLNALGAPFNVVNSDTETALEEFPEITVWFFGPKRPEKSTKLIPNRVVNLEHPTMNPSYEGFVTDYESRGRFEKYLVLQGHPNGWDDRRFAEFAKVVAFLEQKGCRFMTCSEYLEWMAGEADN